MAFKTFAAGSSLPAADINTYLMSQVVVVCTRSTRPASPPTGMVIFETDTALVAVRKSAGWRYISPQYGTASYTIPSGSSSVTGSVTFPTSLSTSTPHVDPQVFAPSSSPNHQCYATSRSASGFNFRAFRTDGVNALADQAGTIMWSAVDS